MSFGAYAEPALVVSILTAGVLLNRRRDGDSPPMSPSSEPLLSTGESAYRQREFFGRPIKSRNTAVWRHTWVSRILRRFPFLVEVWYWLLVYWTYQLARAFTAVTLKDNTLAVSRDHALSLIHLEQRLGVFVEPAVQGYVMARPSLLGALNRIYSFIHIPGTITFLAWLYAAAPQQLFEARRRTLAVSNLMAFVVFTLWPCMPPRLLPATDGFGFVDTVHTGEVASVWTTNRFCNQLAAMPSLHFGYSFVIGLTIATLPSHTHSRVRMLAKWVLGMSYPALILVAIVATANHYVLDAAAGFVVASIAWNINGILKSLLVLEDAFFYLLRVHKPRGADDEAIGKIFDPVLEMSEEGGWRRA
ncbi:PAP2 superfamily-domain-containing protein [Roridomyces roridus]|uniref:PAP2 superfamily-domain-containing protein n=1 Tax=Roridomyces roridus TaxID=1738132 RepID=A0AAD7BZJ7_9AGAR|nr:PAP2 superfamily-domain-containing protein [Roridomyces roridus]